MDTGPDRSTPGVCRTTCTPPPHTHSVHGVEGHRPRQRRALAISMVLTVGTMVAEFVAGSLTGSLMLLSDAVHMLSHAVSLGISYLAIWMAAPGRAPRARTTGSIAPRSWPRS